MKSKKRLLCPKNDFKSLIRVFWTSFFGLHPRFTQIGTTRMRLLKSFLWRNERFLDFIRVLPSLPSCPLPP